MKIKIISLIGLLIILGIVWLIHNNNKKEGLTGAEIQALSSSVQSSVSSQLTAAGVDIDDYKAKALILTDQMTDLIQRESSAAAAGSAPPNTVAAAAARLASETDNVVTDTTSQTFPGQSFFTGTQFSDTFCESYDDLNTKCGALTAENCNETSCCIFIGGKQCVAGNQDGPTFRTDTTGNDIDYAYYSYKNQCYGSCGKGISSAANPCSMYGNADKGLSTECLQRLWKESLPVSGCSNTNYINPTVTTSLSGYNKAAIQSKFRNDNVDTDEGKTICYGTDKSRWPAPCSGTTNETFGLSVNCMTSLFKNAGCTNTKYITDAYVSANSSQLKSQMVQNFENLRDAIDPTSLAQCYGDDKMSWPTIPFVIDSAAKATPFNEDGGGHSAYLDRHGPDCGNEAINQFQLERSSVGPQYQYRYTCSTGGFNTPISRNSTNAAENGGRGNTVYLDKQNVNCGPGHVLTYFQYANLPGNKSKYDFSCAPTTKPLKCRQASTPLNADGGGNAVYLNRHNVKCNTDEALSQFNLSNDGKGKYQYNYTCCKV